MTEKQQTTQDKKPHLSTAQEIGEFTRTALVAVFLAILIRTFFYEPFNIPSGSMLPTLLVGDYLFVNKPAYGYSRYSFPFGLAPLEGRVWDEKPRRGDVVVFKLPSDPSIDYIKRVIGLPGDTVRVQNGRLSINGETVDREFVRHREIPDPLRGSVQMSEYIETLPGGILHSIYEESDSHPLDNTQEYVVPENHYFVMGDNRDNSQDSRVAEAVGFVPYENIVGEADFIFFSTNGYARLLEVWKWPWTVRYDRFFTDIAPVRPAHMETGNSAPALTAPAMATEMQKQQRDGL